MPGTTAYPTAFDPALTIGADTPEDQPELFHDVVHMDDRAAIIALQVKLGIDSSADTASIDYRLATAETDIGALASGKADASHTHAASDITSGTLANARISESSVVQHEAALAIAWDQLTGTPPSLLLGEVYVVANEAAQLALTAQSGDIAIRTDESRSYAHNGGSAGTMADWSLLNTPADAVLSVNGYTGAVSLTKTDVGLGSVDNTSDLGKPISTATQTALDGKEAAGSAAAAVAAHVAVGDPHTQYLEGANNLSDLANAGTALSNLGATTVGAALVKAANPSAITYIRINADNSVTLRAVADFRGDLGLGTAAVVNTGTSGAVIPILSASNTFGGTQTFNAIVSTGTTSLGDGFDDNVTLSARLIGGLGARASSGTLDWDHASNSTSGSGYSLMRGSDSANAPPEVSATQYFQPFNFEYGNKDGSGQITQLAIPYASNISNSNYTSGLWIRGRYTGTWSSWRRIPMLTVTTNALDYTPIGSGGANTGAFTALSASGNFTAGSDIVYSATTLSIKANTADASDTKAVFLCGGGSASSTRGGFVGVYGNDHSTRAGDVRIFPGDAAAAALTLEDYTGTPVATVTSGTFAVSGVSTATGNIVAGAALKSGSYTVATVPSAAAAGNGALIYVSNEAGGAVHAFSDGTNWRRATDRAVIS